MVNMLAWLTGREDQTGQPSPLQYDDGQPSLRAYNPTPSERVGNWIQDLLMAGGAQAYPAGHMAHGMRDILAASPLGIGMSAADLLHAKSAGDPMGAAAAAIGLVPGLKPEVRAVRQGIRAYHGSPHDFDKFDLSKIGTGEGAQAYGHGLYFAENEGVAKAYRDMLAGNNPKLSNQLGAAPIYPADVNKGRMYEVNINAKPEQFLDWDKPIAGQEPIRDALRLTHNNLEDMAEWMGKRGASSFPTGGDAYRFINSDNRKASKEMLLNGIPGIRYLDQGSRPPMAIERLKSTIADLENSPNPNAGVLNAYKSQLAKFENMHNPTSNYVLFNDQLVDIMRKYGLAAPAAAGAASYAMAPQEAQAAKVQPAQFQQAVPLSDKINQIIDSLQWQDQWQGRMKLPLQQKVNTMLGESVWPPLR